MIIVYMLVYKLIHQAKITYRFGETLILWTPEHVERLDVGRKTAQQDWLGETMAQVLTSGPD